MNVYLVNLDEFKSSVKMVATFIMVVKSVQDFNVNLAEMFTHEIVPELILVLLKPI